MTDKICSICGEPEEQFHWIRKHFETEYFVTVEITPDLEQKIKYALMIADRAEKFVLNNPQYNHQLKAYPQAIRQNVACIRGEIPHKPNTQYGEESLLDHQVRNVESVLKEHAKRY